MSHGLLDGKTALVTGAAQGNGLALARGLAQAGAVVVLTDVQAGKVAAAAEALRGEGLAATGHALDVTSLEACQALAANLEEQAIDVSVLVNNAGILSRTGLGASDGPEIWRRVLDVNLNGAYNATYAFLPALKRTRGSIINICSITSFIGHLNGSYAASKGGLKILTQSQALEFAPFGIRANAIAPGIIETEINKDLRQDPEALMLRMSRVPMQRLGQPEELVGPAVFLASDMAAYVTGVILPVDGGFLAV